ncbi:PilW family protein [Sulfuriferula sp. GW1]|uniref:PilW family protein n=1 Tax=Sulfuriferula sp. GW1 TaxID=3345111 RepID=UPI0039B01D6B
MTSRSERGFTLIEMMISLTLGMILIVGVGYAYVGSRQTYRLQDNLARMQEGARYAFETMAFDIRMAGLTGCKASTTANVLNPSATWYADLFNQPLTGYEGGVSTFPTDISASVLTGDALAVLRADNSKEYIVANHNPASAQFDLTAVSDLQAGEILTVTDCHHAAVFQMSGPAATGTANVVHNTGAVVTPGNCTKGLGSPVLCTALGTSYTFPPNSRIMRLSGDLYYIGTNPAGEPALFRQRLTQAGGVTTTTAEELVEDVQDMQITYGVDTTPAATGNVDDPGDGAVDEYVTADQVTVDAPGTTNAKKWARVLSVRISLLMRTSDDNITTAPQTYTFNGVTTAPADRRLRKVFTTTIAIRNRL